VLVQNLILTHVVKKSPPFMEPEVSLHRSQETANGPYPEPDESTPLRINSLYLTEQNAMKPYGGVEV